MLAQSYGKQEAESIIQQVQERYEQLLVNPPIAVNRTQRMQLVNLILPGLALFEIFRNESGDKQTALIAVEDFFKTSFFFGLRKMVGLLNYLPDPFPIVRLGMRRMTSETYLPGSQEVLEDTQHCFAINIYRCFIYDTLQKFDAIELTALYCKTDDWLAERVPKVIWQRTKTLGWGDDYCDFRWCRRYR
jgi:hypothetical protein